MRYSKKTGMGHINLRHKQQDDLFVRVSNKIFPYVVGVLATYGFMELILQANGF